MVRISCIAFAFCAFIVLPLNAARDTDTVTLEDVERIVNSAVLQSQAAARQQCHENAEQQNAVIKELTERVNKLENPSADDSSDRKRLVLPEVDLQHSFVNLNNQFQTLKAAQGVSYVRWGRTVCPNGTDLIYAGFAAGSYYTSKGGGSNYLCLPTDPTWGYFVPGLQTGADVYGAEYESAGAYTASQFASFFGKDLVNDDVPCAVCRSHLSSLVMIPARNICYPGWRQEYAGYLVGEYGAFDSSDFVCMDGAPEAISHGKEDKNGALFYIAEADCGSLSCPPYIQGRELTCTVCTK